MKIELQSKGKELSIEFENNVHNLCYFDSTLCDIALYTSLLLNMQLSAIHSGSTHVCL